MFARTLRRGACAALITFGAVALASTASAKGPAELNDLEIAHVAYTAGAIDIRMAHLALAISDNPKIRAFASTMIRDHSAVNVRAIALVKRLKVTPVDNDVSRSLNAEAAKVRGELLALRGAAFDQRYAERELAYHRFVNGAIAKVFIPNAKNKGLKSLLTSALQTFKVHERHAEKMAQSVRARVAK